jgi:hypothetical protein
MSKTTQNLSATGQKVIYDFRMAAINPDREMTYSGKAAYDKSDDALNAYVLGLERTIRRLKDELKSAPKISQEKLKSALSDRYLAVTDLKGVSHQVHNPFFDAKLDRRTLRDPSGQ